MLQFLIWMIPLLSWVSMMAMEVKKNQSFFLLDEFSCFELVFRARRLILLSLIGSCTSFDMYLESQMILDGVLGKVVSKFCAKYLHQQVLSNEAYAAGDVGTSLQKSFFR